MTDWLEEILKIIVSCEEEEHESPVPSWERPTPPMKKAEQQRESDTAETAGLSPAWFSVRKISAALSRGEYPVSAKVDATAEPPVSAGMENPLTEFYRQSAPQASGDRSLFSDTGSALSLLYRQVAESTQIMRSAASHSPGAGRDQVIVVRETAPVPAGITVGEFDRAVRRDSRRYDGGMTIY